MKDSLNKYMMQRLVKWNIMASIGMSCLNCEDDNELFELHEAWHKFFKTKDEHDSFPNFMRQWQAILFISYTWKTWKG